MKKFFNGQPQILLYFNFVFKTLNLELHQELFSNFNVLAVCNFNVILDSNFKI